MTLRLLEVTYPAGFTDSLTPIAHDAGAIDLRIDPTEDADSRKAAIVIATTNSQALIDKLQSLLGAAAHWRITILPVEATLPKREGEETEAAAPPTAARDELYEDVAGGAALDRNFIVLTTLSTIVAAIGLNGNNVAVLIGAMVIAPLLGPNLAFSVGAALGDAPLMGKAARASAAGIGLTLLLAIGLGLVIDLNLASEALLARTRVNLSDIALALASGAAAALSITTGLSSTLVGVMVAVALMPPAVTFGFMLGGGQFHLAIGALLLLSVNVVCVNLSSQLIFWSRKLGPRTWFEKRSAKKSLWLNILIWSALLIALIYFIETYRSGLEQV